MKWLRENGPLAAGWVFLIILWVVAIKLWS
jgi:hypothetical protein